MALRGLVYVGGLDIPAAVGIAAASFVVFVVSRLYFHPLSKFGGPKIAALTRWYEFYHDVIRGGTYVKYYPELHQKYGMNGRTRERGEIAKFLRNYRTNCS